MGPKETQLRSLVASKGYTYVGAKGNPRSKIWLIGESPGADEDASGVPFCGAAGKQLDGQLEEAGISPRDCFFTNPYHVRPPDNDLERRSELGIPDDLQIEVLYEQLEATKPPIIVTLGATSTSILCPETIDRKDGFTKIGKWKGSLLRSPRLGWEHYVVGSLHPAFILREYSDRQVAVFCLERVLEELNFYQTHNGRLQPLPERELLDSPTAGDVLTYLNDCLALPEDWPVSVDIENPFYKKVKLPYVIGFGKSSNSSISFSLWDWPRELLVRIWRLVEKVLREKRQVGQNYLNYDCMYLEESVGLFPNVFKADDTMIRHKILHTEFEHKLQFQTMQYTREPYFKDEGGYWTGDNRLLRRYNAKDCCATWEIWEKQEAELDSRGLRDFYRQAILLAQNLHWIEKRGVLVDEERLSHLKTKIDANLKNLASEAIQTVGKPSFPDKETEDAFIRFAAKQKGLTLKAAREQIQTFNLGSEAQVKREFLRLRLPLPTEKGKTKSDEEALQRCYAKTGHKLPKIILEARGLNKLKGTNIEAVLQNGTLFTQYIGEGTVNGRRASKAVYEDTMFQFGTNTQNLPKHGKGVIGELQKEYRACLIARPGKIFVICDQVQAEDWYVQACIADQSGDFTGFNELINKVDRHRKLGALIFEKPEDQCGKDTMERYVGKKTRHAGQYDMQAFRFSMVLAKEAMLFMPEICPRCHGRKTCLKCERNTTDFLSVFHSNNPGIQKVYHAYVRACLESNRTLVNPFGRQRVFYGLHPTRDNSKIFKEAYSTLPQSTVSDNTGYAINYIEAEKPNYAYLLKDDHDALTLEANNDLDSIGNCLDLFNRAFKRTIRLEKGLEFVIPVEFEIGYDLINTITVTYENYATKWEEFQCKKSKVIFGITGVSQDTPSLLQPTAT